MATFGEGDQFKGLSVFNTGLDLGEVDLHGGEGFLGEVEHFAMAGQLEEAVDAAMSGKAVPRVWAVLDEVSENASRTVAALTAARILADRGQKVLVLDVDEQQPHLTRWAGLYEQEGWIDYLRFGASIVSCGLDLPWPGARLIGIGSFCPTQIESAEIEDLVGRLRRQADDIILCLPLSGVDPTWLSQANIRLLCWNRMKRDETQMAAIIAELESTDDSPAAVVAFGPDEAGMDAEIESALKAISESGRAIEKAGTDVEEPEEAEPEEDDLEYVVKSDMSEEVPETEEELPAGGAVDLRDDDEAPEPDENGQRVKDDVMAVRADRGNSPLFWRLVAVAALLVIVISYAWYSGFFNGAPNETPELASQGVETDISRSQEEPPDADSGGLAGETVEEAEQGVPTDASGDSPATETGTVSDIPEETGQVVDREIPVDTPGEEGLDTSEAPQVESVESYYDRPVGEAGWALHVYSFTDSTSAMDEVALLEDKGIRAIWRIVELPDRGRWYRVYVGSYSSSAEARDAEAELLPRLGVDWAMPVRF